MDNIVVHIENAYIESDTYDLDVYDRHTLERAIRSLAGSVNFWIKRGKPEEAEPYVKFKNRIKTHLYGG